MRLRNESGVTLVETAVAAAVVAVAAGGALFAIASLAKHTRMQGGAARTAALVAAQQTLRIAQNAWKYGSPGSAPSGSQTLMLPSGSATTAPATLTTTVAPSGTAAQITVSVHYTPEPGRDDSGIVTVSARVLVKAPLPGSQIDRPGLVALPSGAP